jgi:hypothetical protein
MTSKISLVSCAHILFSGDKDPVAPRKKGINGMTQASTNCAHTPFRITTDQANATCFDNPQKSCAPFRITSD